METAVKKQNFLMCYLDKRLTTSQFTAKEIFVLYLPMLLDQFSVYGMSILSSSMGLLATFIMYFGAGFLVSIFFGGGEPIIVEYGIIYLKLYGWSFFPFAIFNSISCCFVGMGKSKHCLVLSIIINLVHLIMSFVFINIMDLGIRGTGYALILARVAGALAAIVLMFLVKHRELRFGDLPYLSFDFVKKIARLALPIIVGAILSNTYIAPLEVDSLAAHGIANSVYGMFMLTSYALMTLTTTVCGQCVGAKNYDLDKYYVKRFARIGRVLMIANTAVMVPLLMLMYQPSAVAKPIVYQLLAIACVSAIALYCDELLLSTCLSAAGDATFTTVSSLIVMWACSVGLGYFLTVICDLGIYGAWLPNIVCYACNTVIFRIRIKGTKWQKM